MAAGDLTTIANVKAWLALPQVADDVLLGRLITAASSFIVQWLSTGVLTASYTFTKDGTGGTTMFVRNTPITAVAAVSVNGMALPASSGFGVPGYRFTSTRIILEGYCFTRGVGNVVVTYTAGYNVVPPDIEQAAIELISLRYRERDRIGHLSETLAGQTVAYFTGDMPASVKTLLMQYQRVVPV